MPSVLESSIRAVESDSRTRMENWQKARRHTSSSLNSSFKSSSFHHHHPIHEQPKQIGTRIARQKLYAYARRYYDIAQGGTCLTPESKDVNEDDTYCECFQHHRDNDDMISSSSQCLSMPPLLFSRNDERTFSTYDPNMNVTTNPSTNSSAASLNDFHLVGSKPFYQHISYLNSECIVAANSFMQMDIIKLPLETNTVRASLCDHQHHCSSSSSDSDDNTTNQVIGKSKRQRKWQERKSVSILANQIGSPNMSNHSIATAGMTSNHHHHHYSKSCMKLHGLNNGEAFIAGYPNGEFQIYATQREDNWTRKPSTTSTTGNYGDKCGAVVSQESSFHIKPWNTNDFINLVLHLKSPTRRYVRDYTNEQLTLHGLMNSSSSDHHGRVGDSVGGMHLNSRYDYMHEIPDWDLYPNTTITANAATTNITRHQSLYNNQQHEEQRRRGTSTHSHYHFSESQWDFQQVGSSILAAHVHPFKDCFTVSAVDRNDLQMNGNTVKPIVCVDLKSKDLHRGGQSGKYGTYEMYEDITSICFVGEWGIATSHSISCSLSSSGVNGNSNTRTSGKQCNVVKFWDRRKLGHSSSLSSLSSSAATPTRESRLISFPWDEVSHIESCAEHCIVPDVGDFDSLVTHCTSKNTPSRHSWSTKLVDITSDENDNLSQYNHHFLSICGLSAPHGEQSDSICISLQGTILSRTTPSPTSSCLEQDLEEELYETVSEDLFMDTLDGKLITSVRLSSKPKDDPTAPSQLFTHYLPMVTPDCIGRYFIPQQTSMNLSHNDNENFGMRPKEAILLFDISSNNSVPSRFSQHGHEYRQTTKKRKYNMVHKNPCHDEFSNDDKADVILPIELHDEFGLSSSPTCFGLNKDGTALICGSSDGDLFMWSL